MPRARKTKPVEDVEVDYNEAEGTAAITVGDNTYRIVFKEPKTKDLILLVSRVETAPEAMRSDTMVLFYLAHMTIDSVSLPSAPNVPVDLDDFDFDSFLECLVDDDVRGIAAAMSCFPDSLKRIERMFDKRRE